MNTFEFDAKMLRRYPLIPWSEPSLVFHVADVTPHYACRLCMARNGLKGTEVHTLPTDIEIVRQHIRECHVCA